MKINILLFITLCLFALDANSQCGNGGMNCFNIAPSCFPLSDQLRPEQQGGVFPGCPANSLDNPSWYAIEVVSSGLLAVTITPTLCPGSTGAPGAQSGLYMDCDPNSTPFGVQCACTMGAMTHSATVNPGIYFVMVDGCAGDQCDFRIDVVSGDVASVSIAGVVAPTVVPADPCSGEIIEVFAEGVSGASAWNWSLPNGSAIVSSPPHCDRINVLWGGTGAISYSVSNACGANVISDTTFVLSPETNVFETGTYCFPQEPGYFHFGTQSFYPTGTYVLPLFTTRGCDSTVTLTVNELENQILDFQDTICQGGTYSNPYFTIVANEALDTSLAVPNTMSTSGCDTLVNINLFVYQTMPTITKLKLDCANSGGEVQLSAEQQIYNSYNWTTVDGTITSDPEEGTIRVSSPGTYRLDVSSNDGNQSCQGDQSITLEPSDFEMIIISGIAIGATCGNANGSIDIDVAGATGPYQYFWSNSGQTEDLTGLFPGSYTVTVTATNGCVGELTFDVTEPDDLVITSVDVTDACDGTGLAEANVMGGRMPYSYVLDGVPTVNPMVLSPGIYVLSVEDADGCIALIEFEINPVLDFDLSSTNTACDSTGGSAMVSNVTGSLNPLISWSNGATGNTITGLQPGGYSVTVEDPSAGCRTHKNVVIEIDTSCLVTISGYVYDDQVNPDCMVDGTTRPARGFQVELNTGMIVFTDNDGYYEFNVAPGEYTVQINSMVSWVQPICADPIQVDARVWGVLYGGNDFYIELDKRVDLYMKIVKGRPRPGFTRSVRICVMNRGADPASGTLYYTHDSLQIFNSASPMETAYSLPSREVSFDFTDLQPGQVYVYTVFLETPVSVPIGTLINHHFLVEAANAQEINLLDNEISCTSIVTNSYDPNDKQVTPEGRDNIGLIQPTDTLLSYQIRFQNTGNDTAYTVLLKDRIDENLQVRSLRPIAASHPYTACIQPEGILEVLFENIYLPDSTTNLTESQGFFIFEIELEKALPVGTEITNDVGIYFDYNAPIETNTVLNTVGAEDVFIEQTFKGCGSVAYNDVLYTSDTMVTEIFELLYNDSIVQTTISLLEVYTTEIDTALMVGDLYNGILINQDTIITEVLTAANGCDSTVTTNVMVQITNTNELLDEVKISAYPNPFKDNFRFGVEGLTPSARIQVRLYDSQGRLVRQDYFKGTIHEVSGRGLSSGLYFYELSTEKNLLKRGKLIKE